MLIENPSPSWRSIWLPLLVLGALALAHDVWYVASGASDGWWPFLWPALFIPGAFVLRHFEHNLESLLPEAPVAALPPTRPLVRDESVVVISGADHHFTRERIKRFLDGGPHFIG